MNLAKVPARTVNLLPGGSMRLEKLRQVPGDPSQDSSAIRQIRMVM